MPDTHHHGTTLPVHAHARRSSRTAVAAAVSLLLGACSAGAAADDPLEVDAEEKVDYASADDMVDWGDDHTHLDVVTVNAPGVVTESDDAGSEDEPASNDSSHGDTSASITLITPSGSRVLDEPPAGLVPVEPANADEAAALEAAEPGSFIAVDVDGILGVTGTRYVRSLTTITELPPTTSRPTEEPAGSDDTTEPSSDPGPVDEDEIFAELDSDDPMGSSAEPTMNDTIGESDGVEVQVEGDLTDEEIAEQIEEMDGVVEVEIVGPGILAVSVENEVDDVVSASIGEIDGVEGVNEDLLAYVSEDPRQGEQWAIANTGSGSQAAGWPGVAGADIAAPDAWTVTSGSGVVIAVIDSGQDLTHRDLASNTWSNPGENCSNGVDDNGNGFVDDCVGWDFGNDDNTPSVPPSSNGSHGTHVAGIVAAAANGVGVVGGAPGATLMPLKVARDDGRITMSSVAAAINYAADNGADVMNLSLGTKPGTWLGTNSSTELAIRNARAKGVVVVVAAGNDSTNLDITGPGWPAGFAGTYDNVVAVGASTNSDTHAHFSNTGSIVGIHAPGWAILSTLPGSTEGIQYGTSMASPYVAAGAAAVISSGHASDPASVIARLKATADNLGWGIRIDLAQAVGYEAPLVGAQLAVSVSGADALVADRPGALGWSIEAPPDPAATGVRISAAARHDGVIGAIDGLQMSVSDAAGPMSTITSDAEGRFPVIPIRDASALVGDGLALTTTATLPATEYAFVVELVNAQGAAVSAPYVSYVSVAAPAPPPTTAPPTTTAPGSGGDSSDGPTTTTAPGSDPSPPPAPTTTTPGDGSPTPPPGTQPPSTEAPTTQPPASQPPSTDAPSGGGDPADPTNPTTTTTIPIGPPPPSPTTVPSDPTSPKPTTTPVTTTAPGGDLAPRPEPGPTTTAPGNPVTSTTQPASDAPDATEDGPYRADSITPNTGSIAGFTRVVIAGHFPTAVPVYVWFGDQPTAAVRAVVVPEGLVTDSPVVENTGVRDIIVKFELDRPYELRLAGAFTYTEVPIYSPPSTQAPSSGGNTGGDSGDGTSGGSGDGTSGGSGESGGPGGETSPTTNPPSTTTTVPGTPPGGGTPTPPSDGTTTTTTDPGTTPPPPPPGEPGGDDGGSSPPQDRPLGDLVLRPQPTTGTLAQLTTASWPTQGCTANICPASRL